MINVKNEFNFLFLNLKAFFSFKIKSFLAWVFYGHIFFYKNKINYLNKFDIKKLHLGANKDINGFFNSQITNKLPINITKKLPFDNNTFDLIFSTHVVEHIHRKQIDFFLKECFRILKPNGVNIICTPSIEKIARVSYSNDKKNKEILFKRQNKWHNDNIKTACHQINLTMRNFGHRFILDKEYCEWLSKKNLYSEFQSIDINEIPDTDIIDYIKSEKTDIWFVETDIYLITK